ncbi:MAG TPA: hypothetical protein VIK77_00380 [Tissierellaceae bacterium]
MLANEECYIPWDIKQDYFIVFQVDVTLINSLKDLIKNLLKLYYRGIELPNVLRLYIKKSLNFEAGSFFGRDTGQL